MARRREIAVRSLAEIPLALPVRPNSLTSVLTGLAASQHFELDIRFEAGSTPLIRDVMLASDLATISPRHVFSREIAAGELFAVPDRAAQDPADHLDVAEFAPSAVGRRPDRRAADPPDGGAAAGGEVDTVIARSACDEAIQGSDVALDCFAEPVIGRAFARPVGSQ